MSNEIIGLIGLIVFMVLMFMNIPLGVAFAFVGGIGTILLIGFEPAISRFASVPFAWTTVYTFSCMPMFCLMGLIVSTAGIAKDLYAAARAWFGHLPGGLAMTTLVVTALFSAVSGSSVAAAATISLVCYPEMMRYSYDKALASGVIASGATMDIMIPPSTPMIIYGLISGASVGKLFLAGFGPGIAEVLIFCFIIWFMVKRKPSLAPSSTDTTPFIIKIKVLSKLIPVIIMFLLVFGGMYGGVFTPTEAGSFGVVSALAICYIMRRLTWQGLKYAFSQTVFLTGTVIFILIGVMLFNTFIALSGLSARLSEWVVGVGLSPTIFIIMVLLLYLVLGALMDEISMFLLTLPFFLPAIDALGIDPIWFGILVILAWQIGSIAPPVGLISFVTSSVLKDVSVVTVYKGCLPFILGLIVVELMVLFVPEIALLPLQFMKMK